MSRGVGAILSSLLPSMAKWYSFPNVH